MTNEESEYVECVVSDKTTVEYAKDDDWILIKNIFGDSIEITLPELDNLIKFLQQAKTDLNER